MLKNSTNGKINFYVSRDGFQSLSGRFWAKGESQPSDANCIASVKTVVPPSTQPGSVSPWTFQIFSLH